MPIAISDEHQELERVARSFLASHEARSASRAMLEATGNRPPDFWKEMAKLGWLGLHVDEAHGGQGFGLSELSVVVEALGFAMAPGPFLSTVVTSALVTEAGSDAARSAFLPALADGGCIGGTGIGGDLSFDAEGRLSGSGGWVLGAELAGVLALVAGDDVVLVEPAQPGVSIAPQNNLDPSRPVARVDLDGVEVDAGRRLSAARPELIRLVRTLAAAEAAGGARAATEMAADYAKERVQFDRPIGTFGPVKHHCANMLAATELATASAWGAARGDLDPDEAELAAAIACGNALSAFSFCSKLNIQVHGGIGYTWEHDAHLYLRRAVALEAFAGPIDAAREDVVRCMTGGARTRRSIELPPEADAYRAEARRFVEAYETLPNESKRKALSDSGYLVPHWPRPWGRDAGPIEQLVIEEAFKGVRLPDLSISGWNALTISQHGNAEQVARFVRPALEGQIEFCQLFSEPGAGSDAAAVQTRGIQVEGGWRVTGDG